MSKPMTAKAAREVAECVDEWKSRGFEGLCREIATTLRAYADTLERQTPDVSGLVEALEAFAAMRPDSSEASENLGTMRLTWEADTDLFTAPIEMTKRARQALSTFKGGEDE